MVVGVRNVLLVGISVVVVIVYVVALTNITDTIVAF